MKAPGTCRERRRAERLVSIKAAALELVVEEGTAFSVHRLAERLDLTVGALYRYFESVDHLLTAVQVDVLDEFDRYIADVVVGLADGPPLRCVVGVCRAYLALSELQPERFRLISSFVSEPDPLLAAEAATMVMEPTLRLLNRLASVIEQAQEAGELSPGAALDRAIIGWSNLQGMTQRHKLARIHPEVFDPERLKDELLRSLLLGWGATSASVAKAMEHFRDPEVFRASLPKN